VLAETYHITSKTLMKVSETELAWVAGERALVAAERAEAPLLVGASAYHLGHTFLRAGRIREATDLTMDAVAALAPSREAEPERLALWGALHLTALFGAARGNDRRPARQVYAALAAAGLPVTGARLAEAAGVSASYGRALLADFHADPTLTAQANGQRPEAEVGER
jgi:hypothetical protein